MKNLIVLPILFFFGILSAQELEGAWKLTHKNGNEVSEQETVTIVQDGYFAFGTKESASNKFIETGGGELSTTGSELTTTYDFHSKNPELVGTQQNYRFELNDKELVLHNGENQTETWQKISNEENELSGNWVITGRKRDGELNTMVPGDRRTIKILGGGRFQWVAFNSETKEFSGTGGGTYTAENGKYTENITFFSRDDSRVGASLGFDYEVKDGKWHHSGKSSTGNPIYEIWSPYAEAYKK